MVDNWMEIAEKMYRAGTSVIDIASALNLSRKTVSKYINSLKNLTELKESRNNVAKAKRKAQKQSYRNKTTSAEAAQLKRQHDIDVLVLSRERFFD